MTVILRGNEERELDSILDCVEDGHQKEGMEGSRIKGESDDFRCILL